MKIKLLHLYYDILNIYGENGNMRALVKALEYQGLKVNVDFKTIDDEINFNDYDFIYVGSGLDESIDITFEDIKKYRSDLQKYINENKVILATGNSLELFSKLGILNYQTKRIDFRIVGDQVFITNLINERIIGFQNRECIITNNKENSIFIGFDCVVTSVLYLFWSLAEKRFCCSRAVRSFNTPLQLFIVRTVGRLGEPDINPLGYLLRADSLLTAW